MLIEPGGTARFGRLCVRASARGTGVGAALLAAAEREARAAGARRIGMHAQTDALALYRRAGFTPYGERFDEEGIEHLGMEKDLMNELRVDPLTGLKSIIAAGRASRPGGGFTAEPAEPVDPEKRPVPRGPRGPHAARGVGAAPRRRRRPTRPAGSCARVPNLFPAVSAGGRGARRRTPTPTSSPPRPPPGAQEVIVNAPAAGHLARRPHRGAGGDRRRGLARRASRAHADAAFVHLLVNERREGGASLPHTHAQLYALPFVPAAVARERERFTAYATRTMGGNLLGDLAAGGGADARPHRRDRRRRGAAGALRLAAAVPAHARPAPPARPLRGRRPDRRGAAARRAAAPAPPARRLAAAEPVDPHRAARAPTRSAGGSTSCRG